MQRSGRASHEYKRMISVKVTASDLKKVHKIKKLLRKNRVNTVCEKARCPNLTRCFLHPTATFIILGAACTRNCAFCSVTNAPPEPVDENEPVNVANAARALKLEHVVITSVTRDDLPDAGIAQFVKTVRRVKELSRDTSVEILTPDLNGAWGELPALLDAGIDIFGHNIEMVRRLYPELRRGADYDLSLSLLREVKQLRPEMTTKSAVMLGLGETKEEVRALIGDVRAAGCDIIVIGQYLQPDAANAPVKEYISLDDFKYYEKYAYSLGFTKVLSFPLARSSYSLE